MSNSIWKTPDQNPDNDNDIICLVGALPFAGYYEKFNASYVEHTTGENYMPDEIDRWCYVDDIIAQVDKVERLQKAVDLALERFDDIRRLNDTYYNKPSIIATETTEEIKQIIKDN